MNTQRKVDGRALTALAQRLNLACAVTDDGETFTVTMETGEIETAPGCVEAANIIYAYAALNARDPDETSHMDAVPEEDLDGYRAGDIDPNSPAVG
jgi:hypothetical protein